MKKEQINESSKVVIFIHGLSGSAMGTWDSMLNACLEDSQLSKITFDTYEYPTTIFWSFKRPQGIKELALALRTFIELKFSEHDEIVLVGHSLGGLISKYYAIEHFKSNGNFKIKGIALYAVPHAGSDLANIANNIRNFFFFKNKQISQLCRDSDILASINSDWAKLNIDECLNSIYVVGGADRVVSHHSAYPFHNENKIKYLVDRDHKSIKEVDKNGNHPFAILRDFLKKEIWRDSNVEDYNIQPEKNCDALFDIYSINNEKFFINTESNTRLELVDVHKNLWIHGKPGIGKTVSLTRRALNSNRKFVHISLGAYSNCSHKNAIHAIIVAIAESESLSIPESHDEEFQYYDSILRTVAAKNMHGCNLIILIEEIPFKVNSHEYMEFIRTITHMMLITANSICWWLSSLKIPDIEDRNLRAKFKERIAIIEFRKWNNNDIEELVKVLSRELNQDLMSINLQDLIFYLDGSPRATKFLFRKIKQADINLVDWRDSLLQIKYDLSES
jgi:predicted alpha/beta hydrolase family esterase/Cdc6-like AAA superfamily ATPase